MVNLEKVSPAHGGNRVGALDLDHFGEEIELKDSTTTRLVQASRIAERFGLWPATAHAVASLCFGEVRA